MRKITSLLLILFLLSACNENTSTTAGLKGTWEKAEGENSVCYNSYEFKGEDSFFIEYARAQGGGTSNGTYENIEGNDYTFKYNQGGADEFTIEIDGDTMIAEFNHGGNVCKYNKVK